jgi:diketogulonate reductase-like aldo/keto reductase
VIERTIPRSGERLPVVGLGTWQTFDVAPSEYAARAQVLQRFVDLGGRLVDTSPMYGRAEKAIGAVADRHGLHDRLFFATKVWTRGAEAGVAQMHESLAKLGVPAIDLMQVHNLVDVDAHLETLAEWKAAGRARYVGVTHYTVESHRQLEPFLGRGIIDFVQCNYSLAVRDAESRLLPLAAEHGVATLINRPFESGAAFKASGQRPLPEVARELGCETWALAFLKYVIAHPAVTCVIPATASVAHLEENMAAGRGRLPDESERRALVEAWEGARI